MTRSLFSVVQSFVLVFVLPAVCSGAAKSPEQILPATTLAFIAVDDARKLEAAWNETQWGKLAADPSMKPFVDDLRRHFQSSVLPKFESSTGVTINELRDVASGELAGAIVEVGDAKPATVVIIDTTGNTAQAQQLIHQANQRLQQQHNASTSSIETDTTSIQVSKWKSEDGNKLAGWFIKEDVLVYSSSVEAITAVLAQWNMHDKGLDSCRAFREIIHDCECNSSGTAKLRWFIDPVNLLRVVYKLGPFDEPRDHPAEFAKRHGLDAVRGIGGTVTGATDDYGMLIRIGIHAPKPYRKTMAVFGFPSNLNHEPQPWIPDDVNMVVSLDYNLNNGFDNVGGLFDDIYADGIEGTFNDIINDLKAADGPRVNVRNDVILNLGTRVSVLNDTVPPVAGKNERSLVSIEIKKNESVVAQAVKRMLRDDPGVKRYRVTGYDNDLWTIGESDEREQEDGAPRFRTLAVMVARGQLMIATNASLIRKLLMKATTKVADSSDTRRVMTGIDGLGVESTIGRAFSRLDRDLETTYELIRTDRVDEFESIYGLLAGMVLKRFENSQTGNQSVDFRKLPMFGDVRNYFGLAGIVGQNRSNGWLITIFTIPSK